MRTLGEPAVLKSAALAAGLMCLACYPRLATALELRYPVWYLEALLFLGGIVLWAFTFGWYTKYTGRPLFILRTGLWLWTLATVAGIGGAVLLHYFVDPALRARTPSEFPPSLVDWIARLLFSLTFTQLLLIFSPFCWLLRLFQRTVPALTMTVMFGIMVLAVKNYRGPPMPSGLLMGLILFRAAASLLSTFLFLRGGVLPVWWCGLILQSRHLFELTTGS